MTDPTAENRLEEVERAVDDMREIVGPELVAKANAEVARCIPPWAEGLIQIDAEAIQALMVAAWLRGYAARREMMS